MMRLLPLLVVLPFFCLLASAPARSADLELSVDPEVLQETRQILNGLPVMEYEGVRYVDQWSSPEESEKAAAHFLALQPAAGDALVTIAVDREDPLRMPAMQMIAAMGDGLTWPQIEVLLRVLPIAYVESLSHYPKGTAAYIRTGYRDVWGSKGAEVRTTSYKFLDGKPYGEPSKYRGSPSSSGGIRVDELGYGAHTAQAVTEYELSYRGKSIKGRFESPVVTFEIIQALTPEIRAAPRNAELDRLVRRICRFVEVKESDSNSNSSNPRFEDPWKPSRTMYRNNSPDIYAIHMPLFVVSEVLPVDLSFDVELQVIETGEIFEGDSIVFSKGRLGDGPSHISLVPRDSLRFAKLKEGFISIKAVLKPSRAKALSNSRITQYYTGTLTSPALRAKTYWFLQASAEPWLVELQAKAEIAKRILAADLQPSQRYDRLTSTNPYMRSYAAYDVSRQEDALRESYLPFLIKLLQDDRTHLPTQPAVQARNALVAIGEPAVDPLIAALTHEAAKIRMRAATALGRIAVPRVVDPLIAALEDSERDVRLAAVNALGLLKDPRSVAPLQATLTDVAGVVRRGAAQALTTIEIHYTVVEFPDPGLEKSIRAAIDKPVGQIQIGDLVGVGFEKLYAVRAQIEDLSGLEYCRDLNYLGLSDNAISNLRPLSSLEQLTRLELNRNRIIDLAPLSNLSNLTNLELTSNPIVDIAPISTLKGLTRLQLNDTLLSDIAPLAALGGLKALQLNRNQISDITGLSNLTDLTSLQLRENKIADIIPLSQLKNLNDLDLYNNQASDLAPLAKLEHLEYLRAIDNNIVNIKPLANLKQLRLLNLAKNPIVEIRALSKLDKLEYLTLSNTSVRDIGLIAKMTSLRSLVISDLGWPQGIRTGFEDSFQVDFSVLSSLANLTMFRASGNRIADMAFVSNFDHLQYLDLARNEIEDIGVIAKMKELQSIDFEANRISDIGVLSNLVHLKHMRLDRNRIVDIGPLANQSEPRAGASITLSENPLNCESIQVHIPALKERGVTVYTDAVCVSSITPNFAPNSGPVNVEIQIESLEGRPHIVLVREQEPPLTAISVKILAPDRVACTFDLTGATPGVLDIVVSVGAHGRKRGTLIGGFTVTDATSGTGLTPGN